MSQKDSATPETQEVKKETPVVEETKVEAEAPAKEETIANALETDKEASKVPDQIPYDRFKEKVDENKELKDRISALEEKASDKDMSKSEIKSDLKDIADEYGIDGDVLGKVASAIQARASAEIEQKLAPLTEREKQSKRDAAFEKMFSTALENSPEYQDIANKEVVKQLAFNPANANKTFSQLLEMMYGGSISTEGKKTMETTTPGKSDETIGEVDYDRAQTDGDYFSKIKSDPALKKQYNDKMLERLQRQM